MDAPDPTTDDPLLGEVLDGRYKVVRLLGRGGMGRVYEGERVGIGRRVAIKLLDPLGAPQASDRARFAREATAAGRIDHPNCVGVSDFGVAPDGTPYLVMDLVLGRTLAEELERVGAFPISRAMHVARHILRGLRHAHGLGLVHRDITPRNVILVDRDGDVDFARLLDFGLAKPIGDVGEPGRDNITSTGFIVGTPRYMAPEQGMGKPADARTDLYALSIVLYELVTGHPPYSADEPLRVLLMHVQQPVPPMSSPAVPPQVEALIARGLAKDPADRPQTADDYLDAIDACMAEVAAAQARTTPAAGVSRPRLDASGLTALAPTLPAPATPHVKSRTRMIAIAAAIAAVVVVVIVVAATRGRSPPASGAGTGTAAATGSGEDLELDMGAASDATGSGTAWRDDLDDALAAIRAHRYGTAEAKLDALARSHPGEGAIQLAYGHLNVARNWPGPALKAYRAAIRRDASLREDPSMLAGAISLLDSNSRFWDAMRFLTNDVGSAAVPALTAAAANHTSPIIRRRAKEAIAAIQRGSR